MTALKTTVVLSAFLLAHAPNAGGDPSHMNTQTIAGGQVWKGRSWVSPSAVAGGDPQRSKYTHVDGWMARTIVAMKSIATLLGDAQLSIVVQNRPSRSIVDAFDFH